MFAFLCCASFHLQAVQVIMLMGPSCAGKSTLSQYLCAELNQKEEQWRVVDFDEVDKSIEQLILVTNDCLQQDINVIIDTNTYEDGMEKKFNGATTITKIIVTAPLDILLQRDAQRTERFKRSEKRAYWCRNFVINSFSASLTWSADLIVDSSLQSVRQSCDVIFNFLKNLIILT